MPLQPVTEDFLALVQRETGYPVRLVEDPKLPVLARVQLARKGAPAHQVRYRSAIADGAADAGALDYLICQQCGIVLRLFENPPGARYQYVPAPKGLTAVRHLVNDAASVAKNRPSAARLEQTAVTLLENLTLHLAAIPIGLRVGEWIYENYPDLRAGQREAVIREVTEVLAALTPELREATPAAVFDATQAVNAAYGMYWAEKYGLKELAVPFREAGYQRAGRALLEEWNVAADDPAHDRELVDGWASQLHVAGWAEWRPYVAP